MPMVFGDGECDPGHTSFEFTVTQTPIPVNRSWYQLSAFPGAAGPVASSPTAGADSDYDQFVFWRGPDDTLLDDWFTDYTWKGPAQISQAGSRLAAAPSVVVAPNGDQHVFFKGTDGDLWEVSHTAGWGKAVNLGGGPMGSAPTAGIDAEGDISVFWEGTDGSLWERRQTDQRWMPLVKVAQAGKMGSAPAAAVQRSGTTNVFFRGRDGNLYDIWHTTSWHGPVNLGARPLGSAPTAGADSQGNLYVFWKGTDSSLWSRYDIGGHWLNPTKNNLYGLRVGSPPAVEIRQDGEQDVFFRSTTGLLTMVEHYSR
jgi:hypothetical protein